MELTERKIAGTTVFSGQVFEVHVDNIECGGEFASREIIRHPGGVCILAIDKQNNIAFVRQYRYALEKELLELPAGKLEIGEDPLAAATRELREETGYTAKKIISLGRMIPTGGYNTEVIHAYLATDLTAGTPEPDEGERLLVEHIPLKKALEMIASGEIEDGKTAFTIMKYNLLRRFKQGLK